MHKAIPLLRSTLVRCAASTTTALALLAVGAAAADADPVTYSSSGSPGAYLSQEGAASCTGAAFNGDRNPIGGHQITAPGAQVGQSPAYAGSPQQVRMRARIQIWEKGSWQDFGNGPWASSSILGDQNAARFDQQRIRLGTGYEGRWFRVAEEFEWYVDDNLVGTADDYFTISSYYGPNTMDLHPGGACQIGG